MASRPVPAEFGGDGFYFRHEHHFVYWRRLSDGDIGIVTILHERMHQMDRLRDDPGD
jgi:plasmid stabilization system protein ParE